MQSQPVCLSRVPLTTHRVPLFCRLTAYRPAPAFMAAISSRFGP
jgi:hypothetical protein